MFNQTTPTAELPLNRVVAQILVEAMNNSNNSFTVNINPNTVQVVGKKTHTMFHPIQYLCYVIFKCAAHKNGVGDGIDNVHKDTFNSAQSIRSTVWQDEPFSKLHWIQPAVCYVLYIIKV